MKVELEEAADADIAGGWDYYEKESPGWGDYFLKVITYEVFERLPRVYKVKPFVREKIQKMVTKRFPWGIFFIANNDTIQVIAVLDCRGEPGEIKATLEWRA